jgi:mRNA deadenylase 3'-5' endonuclease subunit Ccr4
MSYNILCDGYIKSQVESTIRFNTTNARPWIVFDFDYRLALLRAEIMASQSDILCL